VIGHIMLCVADGILSYVRHLRMKWFSHMLHEVKFLINSGGTYCLMQIKVICWSQILIRS